MSNPNLDPQLKIGEQDLENARSKLVDLVKGKEGTTLERKAKIRKAAKTLSNELTPNEIFGILQKKTIFDINRSYHKLRKSAQVDAILDIANQQRSQESDVEILDQLISSCYGPVKNQITNGFMVAPDDIIGVFFEDEFLARAHYPVPYIILPAFVEKLQWAWIGAAHEVGHHVYWQVSSLRDELDVRVAEELATEGTSYPIQRLCFHWLEEIFSDLYGLLLMGRAFLLSGQTLYLYNSISANKLNQLPSDPDQQNSTIQKILFESKSTRHPAPMVRANIGLYAYQKLMDSPTLIDVGQWDANVAIAFQTDFIPNPHTSSPEWVSEPPAEPLTEPLSYQVVTKAMKIVVNVLLTSKLYSLDNHSLEELVNFKNEETLRDSLFPQVKGNPLNPKKAQDIVTWAHSAAGKTIDEDSAWRYWIAAQYLSNHNQTNV
jgi:hypothetical protein